MILPILAHPDPRLYQRSAPVETFGAELDAFMDAMIATMLAPRPDGKPQGVGLAAPQVGRNDRCVVMVCENHGEPIDGFTKLVNPRIGAHAGSEIGPESCLSLPGESVQAVRAGCAGGSGSRSSGWALPMLGLDDYAGFDDYHPVTVATERAPYTLPSRPPSAKKRPALRAALAERDGAHCWMCAVPLLLRREDQHDPHYATLDHIVPRAHGGPATLENLRLACRACNNRRGTNPAHHYSRH